MTNTIKNCSPIIMLVLGFILAVVLALFYRGANPVLGDSPGSLPTTVSSTSVFSISTSVYGNPLFGTSTCSARMIATGSSTIRTIFGSRTEQGRRPTYSQGFIQAASSTVTYPAENFGCGPVFIIGLDSVSAVTAVEMY